MTELTQRCSSHLSKLTRGKRRADREMKASGWIAERLLNVHNPVGAVVDSVAHRVFWMAPILFLISVVCWALRKVLGKQIASPSRYPDSSTAVTSQNLLSTS